MASMDDAVQRLAHQLALEFGFVEHFEDAPASRGYWMEVAERALNAAGPFEVEEVDGSLMEGARGWSARGERLVGPWSTVDEARTP